MLNLILTILFIHLSPLWLLAGGVYDISGDKIAANSGSKTQVIKGQETLGESDKKTGQNFSDSTDNNNFLRCNLFPTDAPVSGYTPTRKKGVKDLQLWAGSSVAIDVDSGTILHYDEGRKRSQIASLTKMMTAILAVENIKDLENEDVAITPEALNVPGTVVGCPTSVLCNGNRMYRGEHVKAIDLLKVMLLNSANDAATALSIHIAGTPEKFVDLMNKKAQELGLTDTHFCTPSGLEIDGQESQCYSSAYDIARIASYSLKYSLIWDIMKIPDGKFYSSDGKYMHEMKNTDLLLDSIPNCLGGKTGFTPLAGKSLLLGSVDPTGKHKVISVVLNDEKRWEDMPILINWIWTSYEWR